MGETFKGRTSGGTEWTIRVVKDRAVYQVIVFEMNQISSYQEESLQSAEDRAGNVILRRGWLPV